MLQVESSQFGNRKRVRLEALTAMLTQISALLVCYSVTPGVNSRILEFSVQTLSQFDGIDIPGSIKTVENTQSLAECTQPMYVILGVLVFSQLSSVAAGFSTCFKSFLYIRDP
jgi:hypothetical protein